jgi:parallel beta-helix repeat protein
VLDASKVIGGATVTFDPGVFSSAQTITLTSGEIPVTGNIVVQGQGANLTSVTGTGNQRVFNVVNPTDTITFTIRDLTFRNTRIFGANNDGGAITVDSENLVLERVNFFNNIADGDGGAVNVVNGTFTWTDGVASGNQTASDIGDGGFLRLNGTTATITRSTISGNTAFDAGGAIYASTASSITLDRSTISGNVAGPGETSSGGGIYLLGTSNISVINSTISGNRAGISGGGIRAGTGTITLVGATVVNNSAGSEGGGLFGLSGNGIIVNDTVVANNLSGLGSGNDVRTDGFVNGDKSVFGDTLGFTNDTTTLTLVAVGQPVLLGPLTNNGGPTQTHLPAFGSPLRNAGNSTLTVDQAGTARPIGGSPDIGSVESSGTAPVGVVTPLTDINATGSASYTVTVRFYDDGVISGIDGNDVRITGPNGFNVLATASKQTPIANGVEVEYQFAPPSGAWAPANAGVYTVSLEAGQVTDGTTPVTAATFGQFRVNLARTFTVTNTNDSGAGSLRQAVLDANAIVGVDTITFDSVTFGSAQTITLTSGDLNAYDGLKVQGPGRNLLTLSTTGYDRHWHVSGL